MYGRSRISTCNFPRALDHRAYPYSTGRVAVFRFFRPMLSLVIGATGTMLDGGEGLRAPSFSNFSSTRALLMGNLSISNYSSARALLFGQFSAAAYCGAQEINAWSCKPCQDADPSFSATAFTNDSTGMQAFVGSGAGYIVVAFRGTANRKDWVYNLQFPQVAAYPKCNSCKVELGFYKAWMSLKPRVVMEVRRQLLKQPNNTKIFVTGHSLGAALAAHCAAELGASRHSLGFPIAGVYTFGQPRVGNQAFADFYMTGTHVSWRLTHHKDPVPHLPMEALGFQHVGTEVYFNEDNSQFKVCDGTAEDHSCADQFPFYEALSISDHLTYLYPQLDMFMC